MAELLNGPGSLDVDDADNIDRFPEGQTAGSVNDGARALEGMTARYFYDAEGFLDLAGTGAAYTVTTNADAGQTLYRGWRLACKVNVDNTDTAPTLTVTPDGGAALPAATITRFGGEALVLGDLKTGMNADFWYDGTNWELMNPASFIDAVLADSSGDVDLGANDLTTTGTISGGQVDGDQINGEQIDITVDGLAVGAAGSANFGAGTDAGIYWDGTTLVVDSPSGLTQPNQPSFFAYNSAGNNDVTGNGTEYTVEFDTERFDRNDDFDTTTDTFTAPITGIYQMAAQVICSGMTATGRIFTMKIVVAGTSAFTYQNQRITSDGFNSQEIFNFTVLANMTAGDTATVTITVSGEASDNVDVAGGANAPSYFCGYLVA